MPGKWQQRKGAVWYKNSDCFAWLGNKKTNHRGVYDENTRKYEMDDNMSLANPIAPTISTTVKMESII